MKLREAELWCLAAYGARTADGYPVEEIDQIWKTVLLHQFHDILPGSSIGWVHREAAETYHSLIDQLDGIISGVGPADDGVGDLAVGQCRAARS